MLYSRETGLKEIRNIFFFFKSLRQRMNCNYCMCDIQRSHSLHFTLAAAVPLTTLDLISAEDVSFHLIKFKFQAFKPKTWRRGLRLKQWGVGSQWQFCARLRSTDFSPQGEEFDESRKSCAPTYDLIADLPTCRRRSSSPVTHGGTFLSFSNCLSWKHGRPPNTISYSTVFFLLYKIEIHL